MNRKIPTRKCIGCGELKEKNQLVRIVRSKEFKKKGLDRSFKIGVPESVYETLKKEMEELYE